MEVPRTAAFPLVLLAGGKSSRLGSPKGLVRVGDVPWIELQIAAFAAAAASPADAPANVVVVTGFDTVAYAAALPWLGRAQHDACDLSRVTVAGVNVTASVNLSPERGPFSSLLCGLARCSWAPGAWVLPVDVPLASPATLAALAAALTVGVDAVLPRHGGRGGHPVLLSATLIARLLEVPLDSANARLDHQLHALQEGALIRVDVADAKVRWNLNTPADWSEAMVDRALPGFPRG